LLHYIAGFEQKGMLSFCCEGQPLATIRSYGFPFRCPICQQMNPLRGERAKNSLERTRELSDYDGRKTAQGETSE
jgi:hypothetical protein